MTRAYLDLLGVVTILVLSLFLMRGCGKTGEGGKTVATHTTDTLYLPSHVVHDTILIPRLVKVYHTKVDTILKYLPKDSLIALLAHQEYQDTVTLTKGLKVSYRALTTGKLDSLSLGVVDDRPVVHIIDSVKVTTTLPPKSHSLGIGAVVSGLGIAPGIQYTSGRNTLGVYYTLPTKPGIQGIQATYSHSLVRW